MEVFGNLKIEESISYLLKSLENEHFDYPERAYIAIALYKMNVQGGKAYLLNELVANKGTFIIDELGELKCEESIPVMLDILEEGRRSGFNYPFVENNILGAFCKIKSYKTLHIMLEEFEKCLSYEITDALIEMKIQGLIQIVLKKIEKSGETCPIEYISTLVYICNEQKVSMIDYLPTLLDFFESKMQLYKHKSVVEFIDKYNLRNLIDLFGGIKEKRLIPILHKHLSALENDPLVRISLAKSLNKLAINFMVPIPYQQKEFRIS